MTKNGNKYRICGIPFELNDEFEITTTKEAKQHDHVYFMAKNGGPEVLIHTDNVVGTGNVRITENGKPVLLKGQELIEVQNPKNREEFVPLQMVKDATKTAWHWLTANEEGRIPQVELQTAID